MVRLEEGEHEVVWTKEGYEDLIATIEVSDTGVSCISVQNGKCYARPGVLIPSPFTVIGYLKKKEGFCEWIENKIEEGLKIYDIMELVKAYLGKIDLGFEVTIIMIMATVLYYLGEIDTGNKLSGCEV